MRTEGKILSNEMGMARLQHLFSSKPNALYTHENSLLIQTKLNLDPDPDFNGLCWCQILFHEDRIDLHRWSFDRKKNRSEVLFQRINKIEWEFRDAFKWRKDWPKNLTAIPSVIRFKAVQGKEPLQFAFLLDLSRPIQIERSV